MTVEKSAMVSVDSEIFLQYAMGDVGMVVTDGGALETDNLTQLVEGGRAKSSYFDGVSIDCEWVGTYEA
jgi:hypothetical protein